MNGTRQDETRSILLKYLPEPSIDKVIHTLTEHKVQLKITRQRIGKLGDYRFDKLRNCHRISMNYNLEPYHFLITLLHEFAHMLVQERYSRRPKPHGPEWNQAFCEIAAPYLSDGVFPDSLAQAFARHLRKGVASTSSDPVLAAALAAAGGTMAPLTLASLNPGTQFRFRGKVFKKMERKRTRYLCFCLSDTRVYLISQWAPIEAILPEC